MIKLNYLRFCLREPLDVLREPLDVQRLTNMIWYGHQAIQIRLVHVANTEGNQGTYHYLAEVV